MKAILDDSHPELRRDLVALSVLKDPIILATFSSPDTVRKFAEHHRVLIEATETIVRVLKSKTLLEVEEAPAAAMETAGDDQLSDDSSSSSSDNAPASTSRASQRPASLRRVTSAQLASALMTANSFNNSLSSLSQRNLEDQPEGAPPTTGTAASSSARITNSMFLSALSNVLLSNRRNADGASSNAESSDGAAPAAVQTDHVEENNMSMEDADAHRVATYQPALDQMFEMGLRDRSANLQAIMLCNGNLQEAINLVLSDNGM